MFINVNAAMYLVLKVTCRFSHYVCSYDKNVSKKESTLMTFIDRIYVRPYVKKYTIVLIESAKSVIIREIFFYSIAMLFIIYI